MRTRHIPLLTLLAFSLIGAASTASAGDRAFVDAALKSGVAEVQRAAVQVNSTDYRVRQYAGKMTTDHQSANQQLTAIASDIGVDTGSTPIQPQPATTPGHGSPNIPASNPAPLSPLDYFQTEIKAHQNAIALFTRESNSGSNPKLRSFAQHTLPTLKAHLELAQVYLKQEQQLHH